MTSPPRITSRQHPVVRRAREIAAGREDGSSVLLDGEHLIDDAIEMGVHLESVIATGDHAELMGRLRTTGIDVFEGTPAVLDAASPVRATSGIVAIAAWAPANLSDVLDRDHWPVIGLVDVQDPGNVGAIIRSADAFGGMAVLALGRTADPGGWKALRGAMGSTFRVPIARDAADSAIQLAHARGARVAATVPAGGTAPAKIDWRQPTLLLLGSEGLGLPLEIVDAADLRVTIPMRPRVSSLNVAATAAVILYEAHRASSAGNHSR